MKGLSIFLKHENDRWVKEIQFCLNEGHLHHAGIIRTLLKQVRDVAHGPLDYFFLILIYLN